MPHFFRSIDLSSDEGSIIEERMSTPEREYNLPRDNIDSYRSGGGAGGGGTDKEPGRRTGGGGGGNGGGHIRRPPQNLPTANKVHQPSDTSSTGSPPQSMLHHSGPKASHKYNYDITDITEFQSKSRKGTLNDCTMSSHIF